MYAHGVLLILTKLRDGFAQLYFFVEGGSSVLRCYVLKLYYSEFHPEEWCLHHSRSKTVFCFFFFSCDFLMRRKQFQCFIFVLRFSSKESSAVKVHDKQAFFFCRVLVSYDSGFHPEEEVRPMFHINNSGFFPPLSLISDL